VQLLVAFGGRRADGVALNELWVGTRSASLECDLSTATHPSCRGVPEGDFVWRSVPVRGTRPPARSEAILVGDAAHGRLLLLGGLDAAGGRPRDLWTLSARSGTWARVDGVYDVPLGAGHVLTDRAVFFFGGGEGAEDAGLRRLDLVSLALEAVPRAGPWPAARRDPALAFDRARGRLMLYGGLAGGEWVRDVWFYSLREEKWQPIWSGCTAAGCVPEGAGGGLWLNHTGELLVVPGSNPLLARETTFRLGASGWLGAAEALTAGWVGARDCDGDGAPEARQGVLCSVGDWEAPLGSLRCGDAGQLICGGPLVVSPPAVTNRTFVHARTVRLLDDATVAVLAGTKVVILGYAAGAWAPVATIALPWQGRGLEVTLERQLLVAGQHGLATYDLKEPRAPVPTGTATFAPRSAWDVRPWAGGVVIATEAGIAIAQRTAGGWVELTAAQARLLGPGHWEVVTQPNGASLEAQNARRARQLGWAPTGAGVHLIVSGAFAVMSYGHDLLVWDLGSGLLTLRSATTLPGDIVGLQAVRTVLYAWTTSGRPVLRLEPDGTLTSLGDHDLAFAERRGAAAARVVDERHVQLSHAR
jgi:hypothetical protein